MRPHCVMMAVVVLGIREAFSSKVLTRAEGPYEVQVYNISNCMIEKSWFRVNVTTYTSNGRRLMRGTVAIKQSLKNVKFSIQMYNVENGKVKVFDMKNQNCRNIIVRVVLKAINVRYSEEDCAMEPTTSEFNGLDINEIVHTVLPSFWYGTVLIHWQVAMRTSSLMCLNINLQIQKINGNKVVST